MPTMTTRGSESTPPTLLVAFDLGNTLWKLACRVSPADPPRVRTIPARAWDRSINRVGSGEKARTRLGFEARVELGAGLERTVAWTRENLPRIEACIERHAHRLERPLAA